MEEIKITITKDILEEGLKNSVEEIFKSSYRNPFKDTIEEELKKSEGVFRELFNSILSEIMTSPDFKKELGEMAMQSLIKKALNN